DNKVVYQKVITGGNAPGYKALGVTNSQDYINWSTQQMNQRAQEQTMRLKTERDQKKRDAEARQRLIDLKFQAGESFDVVGQNNSFLDQLRSLYNTPIQPLPEWVDFIGQSVYWTG